MVLFGAGAALLSWLLEVFGEHGLARGTTAGLFAVAIGLLVAYGWHAGRVAHPLLRLALFKVRTFRVAVVGGFITRLGIGGLPFLLPLLYQLGLGLPAWQSGLLMIPAAVAAMGMKLASQPLLRRFGYRAVLSVNTVLMGLTIGLFAAVDSSTALPWIVALSLAQGFFNSLQFASMNSMAYADIEGRESSMASTISSSLQQLSMSFGLACATLLAGWFLGDLPQSDQVAVTGALHQAFLTLGAVTVLSSLSFWTPAPRRRRQREPGCGIGSRALRSPFMRPVPLPKRPPAD